MPCIAAHLCMQEADRRLLHTNLASLTGDLTTTKVQALHQGTHRSKVQRLRFSKPLTGRLAHSTNTAENEDDADNEATTTAGRQPLPRFRERAKKRAQEQAEEIRSSEVKPASLTLACHSCHSARTITCKQLLCGTSWKPLFCSDCSLSRKACKWLCTCEEPWHLCQIHRKVGMAVHKQGLALNASKKHTTRTKPSVAARFAARHIFLGSQNRPPRKRQHKDCEAASHTRDTTSRRKLPDRNEPASLPGPCLVPAGPACSSGFSALPVPAAARPVAGPRTHATIAPVKRKRSAAQSSANTRRSCPRNAPSPCTNSHDSNTSQRMLEYARRGLIQLRAPQEEVKGPGISFVQCSNKRKEYQDPSPSRKRLRFKQPLPEFETQAVSRGSEALGQAWISTSEDMHTMHSLQPGIPRYP